LDRVAGALEVPANPLLADIRISSENARSGMPEIRDGIPAVFGLELLWNTIGMSRGSIWS